jgi:predicted AAA+ superfamily ATPase
MFRLRQLVGRKGWVLIKGPPQSGKTSLLQLYAMYLRALGANCAYINVADVIVDRRVDIDAVMREKAQGSLKELINRELLWSRMPWAIIGVVVAIPE